MPRGGPRPGAGRKPGSATKKTSEIALRLSAEGASPLEVMLENMRFFHERAGEGMAALLQIDMTTLTEDDKKAVLQALKTISGFRISAQECARDAAPFCHARLNAIAVAKEDDAPANEVTNPRDSIERRLAGAAARLGAVSDPGKLH